MTQAQLAAAAGISKAMLVGYELQNANPPVAVLPKLALSLGVSVDVLLTDAAGRPIDSTDLQAQPRSRTRPGKRKTARTVVAPTNSFGVRLAELRRRRGMTQKDLASAVGVSNRMIAYYEVEKGNPPITVLPKLASALGVTLDELFGRSRHPKGVAPRNLRLLKRLQRVEELAETGQQAVLRLIDEMLRQDRRSGSERPRSREAVRNAARTG